MQLRKLIFERGIRLNYSRNLKRKTIRVSEMESIPKKMVVLTQFYKPEPFIFPPAIAEFQAENGNQVTVVTGFPNRPGGKLFSGYKQRFGFEEQIEHVRVLRSPMVINHSKRAIERVLNFLTFSVSALSNTVKVRDADVVYVYATPATAAIPAQVWKLLFGIPYVLHVQDLWPESVTDSGMVKAGRVNRVITSILNYWLEHLYSGAGKIIAISPGMKELLVERGVQPTKTDVIFNWADESTITPKSPETFYKGNLNLLYAGNLGQMQDLETVIKAVKTFGNDCMVSLKLAGNGVLEENLKALAGANESIEFLGRIPREQLQSYYLKSDFQLVTLKDIPIFRVNVPSKLQASLASGVPVITTVKGVVAELIEEYDAGIVAEPENVDSIVNAIKRALSMQPAAISRMGANARKLYEDKMSKKSGLEKFDQILRNV